ncbi:unnamed protein product [Tilletia laevis]|uniref:WSC domain-containing protein n=2 Tax=Tilletia TaxID=13289 RepID=A0A9N8QJS0_9BASI|nr:hypothetical protein CF336_g9010 [Tilletia laevis]CAD6893505.1 unnamed protein product [Tilletia caries]KAE8200707.1 hypothetical protein CF335_g3897 [Tilletia laevis]CAD6952901.1 unnamed protein product [Tilletia laevis]CAD6959632.1 unnamed protein product [Tilletia caries]
MRAAPVISTFIILAILGPVIGTLVDPDYRQHCSEKASSYCRAGSFAGASEGDTHAWQQTYYGCLCQNWTMVYGTDCFGGCEEYNNDDGDYCQNACNIGGVDNDEEPCKPPVKC